MKKKKLWLWMLILIVLLSFVILIALAFGAAKVPIEDLKAFLLGRAENDKTLILKEIRFPRVIASMLVGMTLGVSGTYMQGMTKNPLASPSLFGMTAGASASLSAGIVIFGELNSLTILLLCIFGSFFAGALVFLISSRGKDSFSSKKMVLAGAAVSTLLYGISDFISLTHSTSKQMAMWSGSGLIGISLDEIIFVMPFMIFSLIMALIFRNKLSILSLDDKMALSLGENVRELRITFFFLVVLLTATAVALSGNIVFVGLIVPHIIRRLVASDYRYIVPLSIILGGILLVLADLLSRVINAPYETPIVAILAMVSFPMFLYVVNKGEV